MTHPQQTGPQVEPSSSVQAIFLFRDTLQKPIEGLSVRIEAGAGAPPAPAWKFASGSDDSSPAAASGAAAKPAPNGPSSSGTPPAPASGAAGASTPTAASEPAADPAPSMVRNQADPVTTDKDGYALTIANAERNQPIDVLVKNQRGEYVWKATVTPKKDISAFTIISPEYHVEATTRLTAKEEFEQNLNLPVVKVGEIMTIERLVNELGPYIGWSQKVTEQGRVKKDFPIRRKEVTEDAKTHKKKTKITIEHHYKVVDHGNPKTVTLNVLGSRLNYPSPSSFSEDQYKYMATQLGIEVAAIKAIVRQESQGSPFLENGLPPILYERRHFYALSVAKRSAAEAKADGQKKESKGKHKKESPKNPYPNFPDLCFPNGDDYGKSGLHQYEKLVRAAQLDFEIALQACSWGGFQILGEYYQSCGCSTVFEFANKFLSGTDGQMNIFIQFMKNLKPAAVEGLKKHNWEDVATAYNGGGWREKNPDYAANLGSFYAEYK
jgi:hypothetical protein